MWRSSPRPTRSLWHLIGRLVGLVLSFQARADLLVEELPGQATDISYGANGSLWIIGADSTDQDRPIYRWDLATTNWIQVPARGKRIAVDPQGNPWMLNEDGDVSHWENTDFANKPGRGTDIAVGANGDVWMIGWYANAFDIDTRPNNRDIFRWTGSDWQQVNGGGVRIAVSPTGQPWIVDKDGNVRRLGNNGWESMSARAQDIGIGPEGSVWITGHKNWTGDGALDRWNGTEWVGQGAYGTAVSVAPNGLPAFTKRDGSIYRGIPPPELRLSQPTFNGGRLEFSFPTLTGHTYIVRVRRGLASPWQELLRLTGNGNPMTVGETPPPGTTASFYSVVQAD